MFIAGIWLKTRLGSQGNMLQSGHGLDLVRLEQRTSGQAVVVQTGYAWVRSNSVSGSISRLSWEAREGRRWGHTHTTGTAGDRNRDS